MKRLYLFLSGKWDDSIVINPDQGDILVCAPNIHPGNGVNEWEEISNMSIGDEREITDWLVKLHNKREAEFGASEVKCFLNDFYSYTIKPICAMFLGVNKRVEKSGFEEVIIITAKTNSRRLPMIGFKTAESMRGSPSLLYARAAYMLPEIFPSVRFKYHYVNGDLLCNEVYRRLFISMINGLLIARFAIMATIPSLFLKKSHSSKNVDSIVVVRTEHQLRFAKRIFLDASSAAISIFPQLSSGITKIPTSIYKEIPNSIPSYRVTFRMVISALIKSWKDTGSLKSYSRRSACHTLLLKELKIPINFGEIADEIRLVSISVFYKNILSEMLRKRKPKQLINFEMVGSMAGLEALASYENNVTIKSIQTVLVASEPRPVFPYCDYFYTDSAPTVSMIEMSGSKKQGEVRYKGPPYPIQKVNLETTLKRISFFSQPYEHRITAQIIRVLCLWARKTGTQVSVRLHPRDDIVLYKPLMHEFMDVLYHEDKACLVDIISNTDLCVTRTSSVAKEAIALGRPILMCIWSAFDQAIKSDYIVHDRGFSYCSLSKDDLVKLLDCRQVLINNATQLQQYLFKGKTICSLSSSLYENI